VDDLSDMMGTMTTMTATTELPAWVPADESKPAPGPLLLVQAFVNTWDLSTGTDVLASADTAAGWLGDSGLAGPDIPLSPAALRQAREVRESLRALLEHNTGGPRPAEADLAPLAALARESRPGLSVDPAGQVLLTPGEAGTLTDGLTRLLLIVRDAQLQGTWRQLKACRNAGCRWAFFDRSHARRGAWCDMSSCGNRIKNRNFRARRRPGSESPAS
jgi:predicted RNA-binding Zn ribbon-like protein